jgi:hypothetical protein
VPVPGAHVGEGAHAENEDAALGRVRLGDVGFGREQKRRAEQQGADEGWRDG